MKSKNLLVGLFVIAGLALFTTGIVLIGNRHEAFSHHVEYYADFVNLSGLSVGAKVQVAGMDAGQVVSISVPSSPASRFRVRLRIDDKLQGLVRQDSVATITTEGVVGDSLLLVRPGSSRSSAAAALSVLPSKEPFDLTALLDQGSGLLGDVDGAVKNVNGTIQQLSGKLNGTLESASTTLGNVNDVVVGVKQGRGAVGMLLRDQAVAAQLRASVGNAQQVTANLVHTSAQADALVSDFQSRHLPASIEATVGHVNSAAASLDSSAQNIHEILADVASPDSQGASAGTNIRESLANLNDATANMADDTEALKRNFFFKGFFRSRGYYNLSEISADKYRSDTLFTNAAGRRTWLASADLFVTRQGGGEALSSAGKERLNSAIAQDGDSVLNEALVVEGYSGDVSNLSVSRTRATLVRQYLVNHFQLDPRKVGAVALESSPPAATGRNAWNGVCLVVVRRGK